MPLGKICWMLWFSSMITRILCTRPRPPASWRTELAAGGDVAGLVTAGAVEGVTARGAEEQPASRKLPVSTVPAKSVPTRRGLASEAGPERFRA
jgi:hypothetical protein